ncbi:MAG TPA: phosphotransferase [Anaerolineae bacterium]|nr:phosphotransferase [Anaerolineae bacterium]
MDEKLEAQAEQLAAIDKVALTPLVQSALKSEAAEVTDWECEQLHGGIGIGTAIYRYAGKGRDHGQKVPWSLVLKTLCPAEDNANVSAWNYYKREADAYQSGWLDDLPGGLAAPRSYGVVEHPDGTCWMWLEETRDRFASPWPLEHYGVVARHLGRFNGAYVVDRPLPGWSWLSSDWLRSYVEQSAPAMEPLRGAQTRPWARRWLPEEDSDRYFHVWAERGLYLDALDRLPQTICHFDIFRLNLFACKTADGNDQTVAIDWAFVGRGPIGADLNPLVWMSIALGGVEPDKSQELEEIVFEGYLEGLREVGWRGDPRQVRLGYTAASVRYLFGEVGRWLALILDESLHAAAEQRYGRPVGEAFDSVARGRRPFFSKLDEARDLMGILG